MAKFTLQLYKDAGAWVFDDPEHRLTGEPLLFGMERLIERLATSLPHCANALDLTISDQELGNELGALTREEADANGYWYGSQGLRGWMGNRGLLRYFSVPPATIYYSAKPSSRRQAQAARAG